MSKVKVLEARTVEFEGEHYAVPSKIELSGQTYEVEICNDVLGEVRRVELEGLQDVKLKEVPDFICIYPDTPELLGSLSVCKGEASLAICVPVDSYFDLIKKIADKMGFEVVSEDLDEDRYFVELTKDFSEDATVAEVYKSFEELTVKIKDGLANPVGFEV